MPVAFDEVAEKVTEAVRDVEADGGASLSWSPSSGSSRRSLRRRRSTRVVAYPVATSW